MREHFPTLNKINNTDNECKFGLLEDTLDICYSKSHGRTA